MLKSLILIVLLSLNLAFAKSRFTDADKQKFMDEVKQAIAAHKVENKGKVDLQIIKPGFYEELDVYYKQEKFTREELVKIKQRYEDFAKSSIAPDQTETAFYKFVQDQLDELNKTQVTKIKEGQVCNNWSCEDGLKCAPDPKQADGPSCKKENAQCKEDGDCCSGSCTLDKKSNKRFCEEVYRCYKPLALGQSCMVNPICGEGECLPFNSKTSGIGECLDNKKSCKKNSECCSNSCDNHKCVESFVCKDCVKQGKKPERGQKCCEGLYINDKGICVPDVPPMVIPQVRVKKLENMLDAFAEIIIGSAHADEAYNTVNSDHDKYESFRATSEAADDIKLAPPVFDLTRKSNFDTCDIRFRDDFMNYLKTSGLINQELALLSFDFVATGDGVNDYWMSTANNPQTSIYGRLKTIAQNHLEIRKKTNESIDKANLRLTCMCLDVKGYKSITDETKKTFFETKCDEYKKYQDPSVSADELEGDASGVKGKRLLVTWTSTLESFNATLAIDNTGIYQNFNDVSNWASNTAKWSEAEVKTYNLFTFSMKNPSGSVAAMGAILGALLAAGIIAVLGGFATTSILTSWAAAGIIATSAITGGTGLWLIASLKGAWISQRPEVVDKFVRSYSCGKKETCQDWNRTLKQPYNNVCNVHTSANACIKNFVVFYQDQEPRYVVDPWIPYGVDKKLVLRDINDDRDYAHKLEDGFQAAKNQMTAKNPGAVGGGGKDGGSYVSEDYMRTLFVDSSVLGSYTPKISTDEKRYILDETIIKTIKDQARKYAIDQQFFQEGDTENLNKFADYTYQYHFIWPKTSRAKEISYPTVGLQTYLSIMTNGVAGSLSTGAVNAKNGFGNLNTKYTEDLLNTLQMYKNVGGATNADAAKLLAINAEIAKTQQDLDREKTLNAILASGTTDLSKLNQATINGFSKSTGGSGDVSLTGDQSKFLNAVSTLREARKTQLKKLDAYNKAIAANGNSDRAAQVASASKKFNSSFSNPLSKTGSSLFGSGGTDGLGLKTSDDGSKKDSSGKNRNSGSDYGSAYGAGSGYGSSGSGSSHSGSGKDSATADSGASGASGANAANDEDARRLQEAIDARNKANKEQYSSNGENSLFEQVTNAYIRNYDKVLIKKKSDKDVQEKK